MPKKFEERLTFYSDAVCEWIKDNESKVLIVGGASNDYKVFKALGFKNVTLTNLDDEVRGSNYPPFEESCQNAEDLTFENESYDYCVIHAALHHCYSPHRALLEMLRVARIGVLFIESRDSWTMRWIERLKLTQTYEYSAVWSNQGLSGGVENSEIPNFIYRWTEREVVKTVRCAYPWGEPKVSFRYGNSYPRSYEIEKNGLKKRLLIQTLRPFYAVFASLFKKQQNLFAAYIHKPSEKDTFPWIEQKGNTKGFNTKWAKSNLR